MAKAQDRVAPRCEATHRPAGDHRPVAHDLYLKARRSYYVNTGQGMEEAIAGYAAATQRDLLRDGLCRPRHGVDRRVLAPARHSAGGARQRQGRAEHALALDEDIAEAHAALAAKFYTWDWPGAEAGFKQAIELNPNSVWAIDGYNGDI